MIQNLFFKLIQKTIHRHRAHAHLRRFRMKRSSISLRARWTPRLSYAQRNLLLSTLFLLFSQWLSATGFSEVHVVEAQWMDIRQLLQTEIKSLAEQKKTAKEAELIAKSTKALETMQKAQTEIAFQMKSQIPALQQHGQLLQKSPNGQTRLLSANGVQFNPQSGQVEGGNFGFTDHLLSQRGVPISMDKISPTWILPVPEELADLLLKQSKEFIKSAAKPLLKSATDSILGKNKNTDSIKSLLNSNGEKIIEGLLKEGLLIRPYEPGKDDAYAYYQNASSQEKMAYFSSPLYRNESSVFNPLLGSISPSTAASLPSSLDLANTFSAGAKAAVDAYLNSGKGIPTTGTFNPPTQNPYEDFALELYDEIIKSIQSGEIKPGDPILVTNLMVQRARERTENSSVPLSSKAFPPLFNSTPKQTVQRLLFPFLAAIGTPSGGISQSLSKKYILAATGNPEEIQQLASLCSASDQSLGEIQKQIGYQSQMRDYTQELCESLRTMRTQAQQIQESLSAQNAIPQITQFLGAIDEAISARDREIANYQRTIQQLQGERFVELKSRAERVIKNHLDQQNTANHQLARATR